MFRIYNHILPYCICLCLLLQSCVPKLPEYKRSSEPKITIPKNFPNQSQEKETIYKFHSLKGDASELKKGEVTADLVKKNWREFFKDEKLVALIDTALKQNQEINILNQEINIANNEVMARQGAYIPSVGVGAGYEYEKVGEYTSQGVNDKAAGVSSKLHNRQLGLNASWEVDIWKKLRNFAKSAYYKYLASIEGKNFAITQLVSEVASDYYDLMALDNQLEIVEKYVTTLQQAQQVVELQKTAARTTSLAVKRFDAEVLKNQSREYEIRQQIVITENHLNKLLGRLPQHIDRTSDQFMKIQMQEVVAGIPAELLDNRPDVKQASLDLKAAKLNVKSVKTQFYPSLTIDAALGYQSFNSNHLLDSPTSVFYNVAGGITAPLLNRKAIKASYFSANSKQIQAIYNYEQTFIKAFSEVSNQLAFVKNLKKIYQFKLQQTEALSESFNISNILFKAARVDYLESLLTRRDYLESQIELIEVKKRQITAYVKLYKALGGGWKN